MGILWGLRLCREEFLRATTEVLQSFSIQILSGPSIYTVRVVRIDEV